MVSIRFALLLTPLILVTCIAVTSMITILVFGTQQHCSIDPIIRIPWIIYDDNDDSNIVEPQSTYSLVSCDAFSDTYDIARQKFRAAVMALQPNTYQYVSLPIKITKTTDRNQYQSMNTGSNQDDENYTIDVAVIHGNCDSNDDDDDNNNNNSTTGNNGIVVHISGTHGVEGFAGSAIQIGYLHGVVRQQQQKNLENGRIPPSPTMSKNHSKNENIMFAHSCHATVVLIHAFNPYGMQHYRRVNEHNVDLNRNGLVTEDDWDKVLNKKHYNTENYDTLVEQHLLSSSMFSKARFDRFYTFCGLGYMWWERYVYSWVRMTLALVHYGIPTLKAALVGGQYHARDGLFYGGGNHPFDHHGNVSSERNEPSLIVVRDWLENFLKERRRRRRSLARSEELKELSDPNDQIDDECITWIDVHTGLGPMGIDTLLFGSLPHPPDPMHLKQWFPRSLAASSSAPKNRTEVLNAYDDSTIADTVRQGYENVVGYTMDYYYTILFDKNYNNTDNLFMVQEFGTVPSVLTGRALIVEHLIHNYYNVVNMNTGSKTTELLIQSSKDVLGAAFYPQRTTWRNDILQRGIHTLQQAILRSSHYSPCLSFHKSVQNNEINIANAKESLTIGATQVDDNLKIEL